MELQGKKAVFLGDSITEGHGTSEKAHIFMNILARETGLSEALNFGIGGTRIARQQHMVTLEEPMLHFHGKRWTKLMN